MNYVSHNDCRASDTVRLASLISNITSLKSLVFGGITLNCKAYLSVCTLKYFDGLCNSLRLQKTWRKSEVLETAALELPKYLFSYYVKFQYNLHKYIPFYIYTCINITKLVCIVERWSEYTSAFHSASMSFQSLTKIKARAVISSMSKILTKLVVLDLEYTNIGEAAASKLADVLGQKLEQLWLKGNVLCDKGAMLILKSLQNLRTLIVLDLSYNNISCKSSDCIAAAISSNKFLQQLWLDGNNLLSRGIARIAVALKTHSRLRILSLSNNGITETAGDEISTIVDSNNQIEDLILSGNQLHSVSIFKFNKVLCNLKTLRKLDLFNTYITKDCAGELADVIRNCSNLQELFLGNNTLETTGALKVLEAAMNICTLKILALSNNRITKETANSICDVIVNNFCLTILLLGGNNLQSDGVLKIAEAVRCTEAIQLLAVCDNNVDEQTKKVIKTMSYNNPDMYLYI